MVEDAPSLVLDATCKGTFWRERKKEVIFFKKN